MDSLRLFSQGLIFKVLLCQPLYIFLHIWVVFQIFIERPDDVQPPVVLGLDQASHNLKAPLFQGIHWQCDVGKNRLSIHIEGWHKQFCLVNQKSIMRPRIPEEPKMTSVAVDTAAGARWQRRVGLRLAVEVEPQGQHDARAAVAEDDLRGLARVH